MIPRSCRRHFFASHRIHGYEYNGRGEVPGQHDRLLEGIRLTECLRLKKSNCKNCYKCIRNCPVKSIRFSDNQANIVPEECILCGHCFVACPQGAKEIRNDVPVARTLIASGAPVYASVAPSFVANFDGAAIGSMACA